MKLTSQDIIQVIISHSENQVLRRWGYDPENPEEEVEGYLTAAENPSLWKRTKKCKVSTFIGNTSIDDMFSSISLWEDTTEIHPAEITADCIVRCFVNTELDSGVAPTVVTDPSDEQILYIFWSSD